MNKIVATVEIPVWLYERFQDLATSMVENNRNNTFEGAPFLLKELVMYSNRALKGLVEVGLEMPGIDKDYFPSNLK